MMNRRDFLATSGLAGAASLSPFTAAEAASGSQEAPEYYELRQYHLLYGSKQARVHDFLREVAIPTLNRMGIGPVGAFQLIYGQNQPTLYLLLPYPSLEVFAAARRRLLEDEAFREAGADFLEVPLDDPTYTRMQSSLMRAFTGMPRLEVPTRQEEDRPRLFELRIYESHSEVAAVKKIHMFNEGGEIAIFRKTGLTPVFFGETLVGPKLPNLTYMLTFEDLEARDQAWDRFRADPDWERLSGDPYYAGTVSNISSLILRPTAYSQI